MYAHPVRLYLVISLFHFFFFSILTSDPINGQEEGLVNFDMEDRPALDSLMALPRDQRPFDPEDWPAQEWEMDLISAMHEAEHTEEEILDSLRTDERGFTDAFVIKRIVRVSAASSADIGVLILENIPIMMFFILPLYALLLKLFYWRSGLYIHHVIHSLHIHSFLFFILGIAWLFTLLTGGDEASDSVSLMAFGVVAVYIVLSQKRVYQQKWTSTLLKFFFIGFSYTVLLTVALVLEVLLSIAFY